MVINNNKINDFLVPHEISSGKLDYSRSIFTVNGLRSDTVGNMIIDNKYELIQPHPESQIYICPIRPNPQPTINELWFYNNCLSFFNEIPSIPIPEEPDFKKLDFQYLFGNPRYAKQYEMEYENKTEIIKRKPLRRYGIENIFYFDMLSNILSEIRESKQGVNTYIYFYLKIKSKYQNIEYSNQCSKARKEIALYASGLRQSDILSEYLSI